MNRLSKRQISRGPVRHRATTPSLAACYPIAHAVAALVRLRSAIPRNTVASWMCREWAERWT